MLNVDQLTTQRLHARYHTVGSINPLKTNEPSLLSYASKGHIHIVMMSYNFSVILNCIMTSSTGYCYRDDVTYQFELSSAVGKHILLALSILCSLI